MYPVKLGYPEAKRRMERLLKNDHPAEALVTAVFTAEKTIRRTLSQLVISAGFTSEQADRIAGNLRGMNALKEAWPLYDPANLSLVDVIGSSNWETLKRVGEMRNHLVHGSQVYKLSVCELNTKSVIRVVDAVVERFRARYGYDGWSVRKSRRLPFLHKDPKVKIPPLHRTF